MWPRLKLLHLKLFILLCLMTFLKELFTEDFIQENNIANGTDSGVVNTFKDLEMNNVTTYHWVCIETTPFDLRHTEGGDNSGWWNTKKNSYHLPYRVCLIPQKRVTIYNHRGNKTKYILGYKVRSSPRPIPYERYEMRDTAYFHTFMEPFEPENFFHLTKQFLFPLHYLIKASGRLGSGHNNTAFFQKPWSRCPEKYGSPISTKAYVYNTLFEALGIYDIHETSLFADKTYPARTCYKNAVFSYGIHAKHAFDAIGYFQDKLNVNKNNCPKRMLTIITRKNYRRILNVDQLTKIATDMGYTAQAVAMENLSLAEQAQLIYCTEILVGVTGAGLQWSYFMRNHSGVIEIAWPHCNWLFFFDGTKEYNSEERHIRPLNIVKFSNVTCKRNLDAFSIYLKDVFYVKKNFTMQETLEIYKDKKNYHFREYQASTIGKLFDVTVDPIAFKEAIFKAKPKYDRREL